VSWSALTPYRLVTTSVDGFARVWDIREACVKRYGKVIGKRPEYQLKIMDKVTRDTSPSTNGSAKEQPRMQGSALQVPLIPLPPLPERSVANQQRQAENLARYDANNEGPPGEFIYNDKIDDGVRLISKLQHERVLAPDTVSARQIPPKVICVARCPYGSHFATGSDDGICRIWRDDDDTDVDKIEAELCHRKMPPTNAGHSTSKFAPNSICFCYVL
jgi:WD40 repeat protein